MDTTKTSDRIVLSRHTLAQYRQMVAEGVEPAPGTTTLVQAEIAVLEQIAEAEPDRAHTLDELVAGWREFGAGIKHRLH